MDIRENAYSADGWSLLSTFLALETMALLITCPIALVATWGNVADMRIGFAIALAATTPFCLIVAWSHNRYTRKKSGYVELDGDMLHYYEAPGRAPAHSAAVDDCLWFRGARTWATLPHEEKVFQIVVGPQVILLQFPEECVIPERKYRKTVYAEQPVIVAVGHTPETRAEWVGVLESKNIVCDTTRDGKRLSPVSSGFATCWTFFCLGFCFLAMGMVSKPVESMLLNANVPVNVAAAIGFSVFVPGCVFLIMWIGAFPLLYVKLHTGVHQLKVTLPQILAPGITLLAVLVIPMFSTKQLDYALAYTVSFLLQSVVTFACYWFLVRPPKDSPGKIDE